MPYSVDTSAFLDAWVRYYPLDVFPGMWQQMDRAAKNGTLLASDEVLRELEKKDDGAHGWVKTRPEILVKLDKEIEVHVSDIIRRYPRLGFGWGPLRGWSPVAGCSFDQFLL